jgi:hypothetical protein
LHDRRIIKGKGYGNIGITDSRRKPCPESEAGLQDDCGCSICKGAENRNEERA